MAGKNKKRQGRKTKLWYWLAYAIIAGLLAYAVVSQYSHFRRGVEALALADTRLVLLGLVLTTSTFFVAAAIYLALALHRLSYWRTLAVELAAALVTRLLPAGIGGLGLHGDYLYRQKHSIAEATAVVSINNAIGVLGNLVVLIFVLAVWPRQLDFSGFHLSLQLVSIVSVVIIGAIVIAFSIRKLRRATAAFVRNFGGSLRRYLHKPHKLLFALFLAMLMALIYASVLLASSAAVGAGLSYAPIFVIFAIGTLVGAATPTPGGLVGVEAGLFAGFTAYGVAATPALAAVLLYRLLTYWLPLVPGVVAFILARRAKYV